MGRRIVKPGRHLTPNEAAKAAGLAVESADQRLEQYARWQETVAALGQVALVSTDLRELMAKTAAALADTLQIEFVEILEVSADGRSLVLRAGHGWENELIGRVKGQTGGQSQGGFTLLANEPVVVTDLRSEKRFAAPPLLLDHGVISGVTVAIGGRSRAYGVLGVFSTRRRDFGADDVHFLRTVANLLATAVHSYEADQAQRDGAARVSAIVNTLVDGIITIDERGSIESVNPAAETIFGYTNAELTGRNVNVLMPEPYHAEHDGYMQNYLRTGKKRIIGIGREVSGLRKDGSTFPMDLAVSELQVSGRRMFTGVVRDITDRRRMEREILEAGAGEQRRIGQDLHDGLCQQLAGIAFATEVLSKKLAARAAPEAGSISKIGEMIDQAITQARNLARGLQPVTLEATGLLAALNALAAGIEEIFHVSCMFSSEGPCLVYDNNVATHLYRIAQEAISNAIKHGKARTVIVDLVDSRREFTLTIKDDGVGLGTVDRNSAGMGLRTMDYRARVIGGTLRVQPGAKGGTTVTCTVYNKNAASGGRERLDHGQEEVGSATTKNPNPRRGRSSHRPRTTR